MFIRFASLFAFCCSACALDPAIAISQYAKKHWQVEDGLPQNYVTSLAEAVDGHLLVGTAGGVARFDGLRFTPLVLDPKLGITREWITALASTTDGSIWVASRDAGTFLFQDDQVVRSNIRFDSLLPGSGHVTGVGPGLQEWTAGGTRKLADGVYPSNPSWQSFRKLDDGSLLIAARSGLHLFRKDRLSRLLDPEPYGAVLSLSATGPWMGTERGLYRLLINRDGVRAEPVSGVPGPVVNILQDRGGTVWAATWGHGIYRLSNGRVDAWTAEDGLPDDFVHNAFEDSEGNLWIGTRAGLSRWKNPRLLTYGLPEGLHGHFISTVSGDDQGIWFGTWRSGLYRLQNGQVRPIKLDIPEMDVLFRALGSSSGRLWAATWSGLMEWRNGVWRTYARREFAQAENVYAISVDREGWLWLGTSVGVFRFRDTPANVEPLLQTREVRAIQTDSQGRVWIGSADGLRVWKAGQWRTIDGLPRAAVTSISASAGSGVYVTTKLNGFCRVAESSVRCLDATHGLPAAPLYSVLEAKDTLWLLSPAGIYSIPIGEVRDVLEKKRDTLEPIAYTQDDGLRSIEGQNVGFPSGWRDSRGDVWFATVSGIVRVGPQLAADLPAPPVMIDQPQSDGENHVVRFTGPRLGSPERVQFRYRIDDDAWVFAGTERTLRFSSLRAGTHRLRIAARDAGQKWGQPAEIQLFQTPRVYETWWFRLLVAAAFGALMFGIYRWRMALVQMRYRAVLAERNRIAQEWHDTLLAGFSAISWQLDATLDRLRSKPETAAEAVETARTMVQHCRAEARHVIWDLRSEEPELNSLESTVRNSMLEIVKGHKVEFSVGVEGVPSPLPGDLAQNVLRICQEAANNAVRHGAAKHIDVRLRFAGKQLIAAIKDDGSGFAPESVPAGHFGLEIMKERAKRFGGNLTVTSAKGLGTTVTAEIPL